MDTKEIYSCLRKIYSGIKKVQSDIPNTLGIVLGYQIYSLEYTSVPPQIVKARWLEDFDDTGIIMKAADLAYRFSYNDFIERIDYLVSFEKIYELDLITISNFIEYLMNWTSKDYSFSVIIDLLKTRKSLNITYVEYDKIDLKKVAISSDPITDIMELQNNILALIGRRVYHPEYSYCHTYTGHNEGIKIAQLETSQSMVNTLLKNIKVQERLLKRFVDAHKAYKKR